jgi:ATP-dependent 26S proteasome regulatory subunit
VCSECRNLGDGQAILQEAFRLARISAPTLMMIDDIDTICGMRSSSEHMQSFVPILSTLLVEMDGPDEGAAST